MKQRLQKERTRLGQRSTIVLASAASFAVGAAAFAAVLYFLAPALGMGEGIGREALAAASAAVACLITAAAIALAAAPSGRPAPRAPRESEPPAEDPELISPDLELNPGSAPGPAAAAGSAEADSSLRDPEPSGLRGIDGEFLSPDAALLREAKIALKMQRHIVPRLDELPARPELAFGAAYLPADNTGGDIYDVARAGKNGYAFLIADVSGRGVPAALISAMVKNAFRSKASWHADAAEVMAAVNDELMQVLGDTDCFVTAFYAVLDLENGSLSYANAGHPPVLLMRRRLSETEDLDAEGAPLGIGAGQAYAARAVRLEEGDRIVLFTDGVTSARNFRGEEFSRERLAASVAAGARLPAAELAASLADELKTFSVGAPPGDDTVLMVCEFRSFARPPGSEPSFASRTEDDYPSLSRKGAYLASTGKIAEAARVYERLLSIEPEDPTALSNLGTLYWKMGRKAEAARRFREAARVDPKDPRIARNLALAEREAARGAAGRPAAEPAEPAAAAPDPAGGLAAASGAEDFLEDVEEAEPVGEL